ncbi:hypothetical protein F8388_007178 [Cannabis sativa]|uniref:Uncharacterized protein n=1 Tax=Cannabis sativa TaxID=3483 RepID=A0A7J6EGZ3_CANSA|nr:hypothetical protein F8388_007178 [Cannabis sativa]
MAALRSNFHVRSNSLPSKSHPVIEECNNHLLILGASHATSSSSSIARQLSGLEDLHICVEKLLQLPLTRQAFSQGRQEKWVDELVDGSLRLLDLCSTAKDAVLHTKECARDIQSTMRRKVSLESEIKKYSASRKVVKKAIQKALKSLKGVESKDLAFNATKSSEISALVSVMREVEASKLSGWSLVSKLVQSKRVAGDEDVVNEFAKVDAALLSQETNKAGQAMLELKNLEMCVQDFEQMLESLFRRLIKTRVSLLNILNN